MNIVERRLNNNDNNELNINPELPDDINNHENKNEILDENEDHHNDMNPDIHNQNIDNGNPEGQERDDLMKEWEDKMSDFNPAEMMTFEILARSTIEFFEDIHEENSYIRGAYFCSSEEGQKIDFSIRDPSGNIIFERIDKPEAVFYFTGKSLGHYHFTFTNSKIMESYYVTFAVH